MQWTSWLSRVGIGGTKQQAKVVEGTAVVVGLWSRSGAVAKTLASARSTRWRVGGFRSKETASGFGQWLRQAPSAAALG